MDILPLTSDTEGAYRAFLREDSRGQVYGSLEYRDFLSAVVPGEPHYLLAWDMGKVVGILPYFRQTCPGVGTVINSLPWYGSHGGCLISPTAGDSVRHALVSAYRAVVQDPEVLSATMILTPEETLVAKQYLDVLHPAAVDHRIGQVTRLPDNGPDLQARLERRLTGKTRNLVRKSLKQGFSLRTDDEEWAWQFLYETHRANIEEIGGRAKRWGDFVALRKHIPPDERCLLTAMDQGQPVASLLLLYFNQTVEYFTPVIKLEHRSRQPLSFLIWQGMLDAVKKGYSWWNWGGTWESQRSLYHFKAGWGAEDRPYTYLIHLAEGALDKLRTHQKVVQDMFWGYYTHPYHVGKV